MAGSEIYRVEIPIIVEDQTEAPLKQAEQRINRLEQSAQKTNNRIRKMFGRSIRLSIGAIDKAWPVIKGIQTRLRGLTSRAWKITLQARDKVTGTIKSIFRTLTSPLALLGAGAGVGAGVIFPLKLAGEFEQARMSLDFYMGSIEKGKAAFEDLIRFAAETPFEFPFLQEMTIQLMGTGYNFEQAKRALIAFGDAAGRTGAGMQGVEAAMLGFTQIASAGTLNLQDLKQVALNLKLPLNIFAKELGVAESAMGDIGRAGISSQKAMEAIVRTLEKRYAGGLKQLSGSLFGLVSTVKDTARLTVAAFGTGMADPVKRILLDIIGMTDYTSEKFKVFQRKLEDIGRRIGEKFEEIYWRVKQFFQDIFDTDEFKEADIIGKMIILIEEGMPVLTEKGIEVGKAIGKAIAKGLYEAIQEDPWLGILLGGYIGYTLAPPGFKVQGLAIGAGGGVALWGLPKGFEALKELYVQGGFSEREREKEMLEGYRSIPMGNFSPQNTFSRPYLHTGSFSEREREKEMLEGYRSIPNTTRTIMPFSTRIGSRDLGFLKKTNREFGVNVATAGTGISVMNNINVSVNTTGNVDPDRIADTIAVKIEKAFRNMPK